MNKDSEILDRFVSVIWVLHNNCEALKSQLKALQSELDTHFTDYEILLIDQRSDDETAAFINAQLKEIPCIRFIELAFRVDHDVAVAAGIENSIGDYVVLINPSRDPIHVIRPLVDAALVGSDIVYGVAEQKRTLAYRSIRPLAGFVLKRVGYDVPKNATGLIALSRRAANAVMSVGRFHHQFFVRLSKTGYGQQKFPYSCVGGASEETKTGSRGLNDLIRMVIYNSTLPLRWMSMAGIVGSGLAFLFALYSFLTRLFMENVAAGWASSVMFQSVMFMLLFAMLAFFGEYLARLLDDQSGVKSYSVVYEAHSSVLLNEDRHNVLDESTE